MVESDLMLRGIGYSNTRTRLVFGYIPIQLTVPFNLMNDSGGEAQMCKQQRTCKAWWKLAMVIDPFPIEMKEGIDAVEIGAYKMVTPGEDLTEMGDDDWTMGWRSASILVKEGGVLDEK